MTMTPIDGESYYHDLPNSKSEETLDMNARQTTAMMN